MRVPVMTERILYYVVYLRLSKPEFMSKKRLFLMLPGLMVIMAISYYSCVKDLARLPVPLNQSYCDTTDTRFSTVILPMMQTHCATTSACHDGSPGASGPLDMNKYDDIKYFYDFGLLQSRVFDLKDMPPSAPLPDSLLKKLQCWMGKGAQNN